MKPKIIKKDVNEFERNAVFYKEEKITISFNNNKEIELSEEEKIRRSGIKKKVSKDNYFPDPCDCESCMYYDEENNICKKNNEFFYHDMFEGEIECDDYSYIYELEN